jgi:hypothetical protein
MSPVLTEIMDEKVTKPTIETVLERIADMEERLGVRLDRIESVGNATRSEMLDLRADFRELRTQLREHFPALR